LSTSQFYVGGNKRGDVKDELTLIHVSGKFHNMPYLEARPLVTMSTEQAKWKQ